MKAVKRKKEYVALITAFIFTIGIIISLIYVVKASDHKCTQKNCVVCASMSRALSMLKENLSNNEKPKIKTVSHFSAVFLILFAGFIIEKKTPVSEKIRIEC